MIYPHLHYDLWLHNNYKTIIQRQIRITKSKDTQREENIVRNIFLKSKLLNCLENRTKYNFTIMHFHKQILKVDYSETASIASICYKNVPTNSCFVWQAWEIYPWKRLQNTPWHEHCPFPTLWMTFPSCSDVFLWVVCSMLHCWVSPSGGVTQPRCGQRSIAAPIFCGKSRVAYDSVEFHQL